MKAELLSAVRSKIGAAGSAATGTEKDAQKDEKELEALRQSILVAPAPEKRPKLLENNASDPAAPPQRTDDYYWLRDDARKSKAVLSHLAAENAYVAASLADTDAVKDRITKELRAAIQEADEGAPVRKAGYWWWWRTKEGGEYRQHVRRKVSKAELSRPPTERDAAELVKANAARAAARKGDDGEGEEEEIILDEDARAKGKSFYMTGGDVASPAGDAIAWGEDLEGGEKYTLHCINLLSGLPLLRKPIPHTAGNFVFSSPPKKDKGNGEGGDGDGGDASSTAAAAAAAPAAAAACTSTHLFYTTKDALDRPHKVWRHRLGSDASDDVLVFHEEDDAFYVSVGRTRDGALILVSSGSAITTEVRALKADEPESELAVLLPRTHDVEYDVGCHSAAGRVREREEFFVLIFFVCFERASKRERERETGGEEKGSVSLFIVKLLLFPILLGTPLESTSKIRSTQQCTGTVYVHLQHCTVKRGSSLRSPVLSLSWLFLDYPKVPPVFVLGCQMNDQSFLFPLSFCFVFLKQNFSNEGNT